MQKETLYGLGGIVIGVLLALFVSAYAVNTRNGGMMRMMGMNTNQHSMMGAPGEGTNMDQLMSGLQDKKGDDFDKAFLTEMINHHEGAIIMATVAKQNAKHEEIKKMADDIISTQTKEMDLMKQWQKEWSYDN